MHNAMTYALQCTLGLAIAFDCKLYNAYHNNNNHVYERKHRSQNLEILLIAFSITVLVNFVFAYYCEWLITQMHAQS